MVEINSKIVRRKFEDSSLLPEVSDPYLRRIVLSRGVKNSSELDLSLKSMLHYSSLNGIEKASELLYDAMLRRLHIVVVGDYDVDGATSTALAVRVLRRFGCENVSYFIPDRVSMGYGLSAEIVDIVHQQHGAELIITVDNGITSFEGAVRARELGIKLLITDHHLSSETVPDADVIVNPNQNGCPFPSKAIAGVGVIFYVMAALRALLSARGWFEARGISVPLMSSYLDLVAVGSLADVVSLDCNNRIMIRHGIEQIRRGTGNPSFPIILFRSSRAPSQASESDICHLIAPLLNAVGRIDNMSLSIECLLSDDPARINMIVDELQNVNVRRREIENQMRSTAVGLIEGMDLGRLNSIVLFDPSFHQGVIGIVASRLKDMYSRPIAVFAPSSDDEIKGSVRSVTGLNMKTVLENISRNCPDLILRYGGHAMAAGLTIRRSGLDAFTEAFRSEVAAVIGNGGADRILYTDGYLPADHLTLDFVRAIKFLGPWGTNFEYPVFEGDFLVQRCRFINECRHLRLSVSPEGSTLEYCAMLFNIPPQIQGADLRQCRVKLCYRLELNNWRGSFYLQLIVEDLTVIERLSADPVLGGCQDQSVSASQV